MSSRLLLPFLVCTWLLVCACTSQPEPAPAIGEAYVGPATLKLRKELSPGTQVMATVKHGDRLEILRRRRRFVKVRTEQGAEGWTDSRQLLTPAQMDELRQAADRVSDAPSMGKAYVYDAVNVHIDPYRPSPVFYQIPEMGTVEVIGHSLTPRNAQPPQAAQPAPVSPEERPLPKKPKRQPAVPPPPPPPTPALPADWIERSKSAIPPEPAVVPEPPKTAPVRLEDWSLVRTSQGRVGWALTRMLTMAIPDEVAQYAEGHRITSYFSLGEVRDGELRKHHWLWTTHSEWAQPYQFDSFRVFIWSIRRHRYETAYIERDVRGYFPVEVHTVEVTENRKPVKQPAFTLILETEDGSKVRKTYAFQPHRVRLVSKAPYQEPVRQQQQLLAQAKAPEKSEAEPSLGNRFLDSVRGWKKRLLGR